MSKINSFRNILSICVLFFYSAIRFISLYVSDDSLIITRLDIITLCLIAALVGESLIRKEYPEV